MSLLAEERETIITTDDSLDVWDIYTGQRKIMTKIEKLGVEPYKVEKDEEGSIISKSYKLDFKQISFRNIREMSEEEKEKRRQIGIEAAKRNFKSKSLDTNPIN